MGGGAVTGRGPTGGEAGRRRMRLAIVNDDMPFLVDSVAAVIAGYGLTVHRLLHPIVHAVRDVTHRFGAEAEEAVVAHGENIARAIRIDKNASPGDNFNFAINNNNIAAGAGVLFEWGPLPPPTVLGGTSPPRAEGGNLPDPDTRPTL